jgi:hypothetical protein
MKSWQKSQICCRKYCFVSERQRMVFSIDPENHQRTRQT